MDLKAIASRFRFKRKGKLHQMPSRTRLQVWCVRVTSSILLWTCIIQLMALGELWRPHLPTCFNSHRAFSAFGVSNLTQFGVPPTPEFIQSASVADLPLPRTYKSNGYLEVSCNGGLNQMRAAICDMVTVAHYLNLTLVVPELDKTSFWADPSDFGDIFDVNHFMTALRGELRIVKKLPKKYVQRPRYKPLVMAPVSWSNEKYYLKQILPLFRKHKVVHFNRTDARLANNNLPIQLQKLRCKVNYHALKFTPKIEKLGQKIVRMLREKGPFVVLHLRYEMDMLAFSGCTHGCTEEEANELKQMRYAYPWWKEKEIDSNQKRLEGLCPLTPEETALVLKALGLDRNIQIYIAAGRIYGGERRLAVLRSIYPNIVRKEMLLRPCELEPLQNHSSQMAALDYLVSIESDIFIPTYDGNMAKVVEGHRRHLGFQKTFLLDRKQLVGLLDMYQNKTLQWQEFSNVVKKLHKNRTGMPARRKAIAEKPKEEDYFYANPQECLCNNRSCTM